MVNAPSNRAKKTTSGKRPPMRKGLVIVNTGMGKGKSTAAFGIMFRAWGRGMKVCAVQFIKNDKSMYGEQMAAHGPRGPDRPARAGRDHRCGRSRHRDATGQTPVP